VDYQSDEADISSAESDYSTGSRGHLEFAENNSYDLPPLKFSELGYKDSTLAPHHISDRTHPSRFYSTNGPFRKKGFMPGAPGPDKPPASSITSFKSSSGRPSSERQRGVPQNPFS
jgi:hypothetical protein